MICPKCRRDMPLEAYEHSCGWKADLSTLPREPGCDDDLLAPVLELEPPPQPEPPRGNYTSRTAAALRTLGPRTDAQTILQRWREILADPRAVMIARSMAREAIAVLEGRNDNRPHTAALKAEQPDIAPPAPADPRPEPPPFFEDMPEDALEAEFRAEGINARPADPRRQKPLDSRNSR